MVNVARTRRNSIGGSPEVGEIDTKAPFQSVKAAVSLFGEALSSSSPKAKPLSTNKKPKPQTQEVLDKEAQFHLALNELNKLKEQLRGAESKKSETLPELDEAKRTLDELKQRLKSVNESKQSILETSEALKDRARKLEEALSSNNSNVNQDHVDKSKEEYKASISELDALKQQLSNVRREYDATLEAKTSAIRISEKADAAAEAHRHRVSDLTKQIGSMQEALTNIRSRSKHAEAEHQKLLESKDKQLSSSRLSKQELERKVRDLKSEHQPLLAENDDDDDDHLRVKLEGIDAEISSLQDKLLKAKAAHYRAKTSELERAKKSLEQIVEEKTWLEKSVESLKQELQHVGKELTEHKHKQEETDALVNKLQAELDDKKNVLEAGLVNKTSAADASDDMVISIEQLTLETERAKQDAQEMRKMIEEQQQVVKSTRNMIAEMENKLESLLKQAEDAKAAEKAAQDEIRVLSEKAQAQAQAAQDQSTSESSSNNSNGKVKVSNEEYNSLLEKVDESGKLADIKVTANLAQVEALVSSQKEAAQKYEGVSKEIEELKMKEEEALKTAEMAEEAKTALEAELHRRRQHQQEHINETTQLESTT